ncbi:hypothetical protein APY03_3861 [Variovorax sp. WDL1]|nr:hypothetical protein APY03_3861 [Variovorax sp. WDL1]
MPPDEPPLGRHAPPRGAANTRSDERGGPCVFVSVAVPRGRGGWGRGIRVGTLPAAIMLAKCMPGALIGVCVLCPFKAPV